MSTAATCLPVTTSGLREFFRNLIAKELNKRPDEVTLQFIVTDRQTRFYPSAVYSVGSSYGGYRADYLPVLSLNQFEALERHLDAAIQRL
jgi:hypothetical protein